MTLATDNMEEYFSADRLLRINIASILHINRQGESHGLSVNLVGLDAKKSVISSLPPQKSLPEGEDFASYFCRDTMFEMKTIYSGRIVAFESSVLDIYNKQLLISSYPEMIETRKLRRDTRFPCVLPCDLNSETWESYGAITNISHGGCQLRLEKNLDQEYLEKLVETQKAVSVEVYFPYSEVPMQISIVVKSISIQLDDAVIIGAAFVEQYDCIYKYLETLQLDSVSSFFN